MSPKDINKGNFSEETLLKLDIFENYTRAWLPIFLSCQYYGCINICDFFSGSGYDLEGIPGSSIRIVDILNEYSDLIISNKCKINIIFNDKIKKKYHELKQHVENELNKELNQIINIEITNQNFSSLFNSEKIQRMKNQSNLFFIDQYGFSRFTIKELLIIEKYSRTDFIVFSSSSFIKRFFKVDFVKKRFPDLDYEKVLKTPANKIHDLIVNYYKSKLPYGSKIVLYPFTIKKRANYHGLIFGTKHIKGIELFLDITWKKNPENGLSNISKLKNQDSCQGLLFNEYDQNPLLIDFKKSLQQKIWNSNNMTNKELYIYTLKSGFPIKHTTNLLRELKKENRIYYKGHSCISYDKCFKNIKVVNFQKVE